MAYCYRCGVKLEEGAVECPLCGTPVPEDARPTHPGPWPADDAGDRANYTRRPGAARTLATQVLLVVFMTPALVMLAITLVIPAATQWTGYILVTLMGVWAMATIPLVVYKRPFLIVAGELVAIIGMMVALDMLGGGLSWSLVIGVPVVILASTVAILVTITIVRMRERGANAAAVIITGIGVLAFGLDLIISGYLTGTVRPSWSVVVLAALSPVAGFLAYYHRSLRRRVPFGRRFHV